MDKVRATMGLLLSFSFVCFSLFALTRRQFSKDSAWLQLLTGARSEESLRDALNARNRVVLGVATCALLSLFVVQVMCLM